jgi:hypothetical protein
MSLSSTATLHQANTHFHTAFRNVCLVSSLALLSLAARRYYSDHKKSSIKSVFLFSAFAFLTIAVTIAVFLYRDLQQYPHAAIVKWRRLLVALMCLLGCGMAYIVWLGVCGAQ